MSTIHTALFLTSPTLPTPHPRSDQRQHVSRPAITSPLLPVDPRVRTPSSPYPGAPAVPRFGRSDSLVSVHGATPDKKPSTRTFPFPSRLVTLHSGSPSHSGLVRLEFLVTLQVNNLPSLFGNVSSSSSLHHCTRLLTNHS